jgi:hypothetical protein
LRVLAEQDWIESYLATDPCLFDELLAAYVARGRAKAAGASAEDLAHGDRALAAIKSGDSKDEDAWGRAATAIRRFGEALGEIRARPKPQHGHALRKRGFIAPVNGDCPATEDLSVEPTDGLVVTFGEPLILTSEALKSGGRVG